MITTAMITERVRASITVSSIGSTQLEAVRGQNITVEIGVHTFGELDDVFPCGQLWIDGSVYECGGSPHNYSKRRAWATVTDWVTECAIEGWVYGLLSCGWDELTFTETETARVTYGDKTVLYSVRIDWQGLSSTQVISPDEMPTLDEAEEPVLRKAYELQLEAYNARTCA